MKYFLSILLLITSLSASAHRVAAPGINGGFYQSGMGSWVAGDTIVFTPGTSPRTYFTVDGVHGTPTSPIVFYMQGGEIEMYNGFALINCHDIEINGDDVGITYGIRIHNPTGYSGDPFDISGRSYNIKIHGFWAYHTNDGIRVKNDLSCDSTNKWPWRFTNIEIYNFKLGGDNEVVDYFPNEGMYLGNTDPLDTYDGNGDPNRFIYCNGDNTTKIHYRVSGIGGFKIHDFIIKNAHRQAINFSGADTTLDNYFYNFTIYNAGNGVETNQGAGIFIGSASRNVHIYNGTIRKTFSNGIHSYCESLLDIHDVTIDSTGYCTTNGIDYQFDGQANISMNTFGNSTYRTTFKLCNNTLTHTTATKNIELLNNGNFYTSTGNLIGNSGTVANSTSIPYGTTCPAGTLLPPIVNAGNDTAATNPATIDLFGSYTISSPMVSVNWSNSDGCTIYTPDSVSSYATCDSGTHVFTFTVTDSAGLTGSDTKSVHLTNPLPDTIRIRYLSVGQTKLRLALTSHSFKPNTIQYGVFTLGTSAGPKIDTANAIGNLDYIRYNFTYTSGLAYNLPGIVSSGYKSFMTFGWYPTNVDSSFVTDTVRYKQVIDSLLTISSPTWICPENEMGNYQYRPGMNGVDYANLLKATITVAKAHNVKVTDGGWIYGNMLYPCMRYAAKAGDTATLGLISRAVGINISDTVNDYAQLQLGFWDQLYPIYKDLPVDAINLHWYEGIGADSIHMSGLFPTIFHFMQARFPGKAVVCNEFGTIASDPQLLYDYLNQLKTLPLIIQIYFSANGTKAVDLHNILKIWLQYNKQTP